MKVLLVGHGRWGSLLRDRLDEKLGVDNVLVVDEQQGRLPPDHVCALDYRELHMLFGGEIEAVVVATLPWQHYEIALDALQRGKHVLVEKPLTMDLSQAKILQEAAALRGLTLMTDDTWQYASTTRELIDCRLEHDVVEFEWDNPREETPRGGILWTQGPHPVSLMLALMGGKPETVIGTIEPRLVNVYYGYGPGRGAQVKMSWDIEKARRISWWAMESGDRRPHALDADKLPESEDPVSNMLDKFLGSLQKPWVDQRAIDVVEVLSWSQSQLSS